MEAYLNLLREVRSQGVLKEDRTGTGTLSLFGRQIRFDLSQGFPAVTTKKLHLKSILYELLWFLRGDTNIGCMGRGVGLQTAMGRAMASYIASGKREDLPVPITAVSGLPLHQLRRLYISAIVSWYRLRGGGLA